MQGNVFNGKRRPSQQSIVIKHNPHIILFQLQRSAYKQALIKSVSEPGCAVLLVIKIGELSAEHLRSYQKLKAENAYAEDMESYLAAKNKEIVKFVKNLKRYKGIIIMENKLSFSDLICGTHLGLERQGPGSPEMTIKALSFLDNLGENSRVVDLGCGTGGQTMTLAQNITGNITGIDQFPEFINLLNDKIKKLNLQERVNGIVGDMLNLPFGQEEFDLVWSEGAIDSIGFEKGLTYWNGFLKKDGYVVVTCPSWLTDEHPVEIEQFWRDAGSGLDTIGSNVDAMQKAGYIPVAVFTLPEKCWMDYFIPREAAGKALLEKHTGNEAVVAFIEDDKHEVELYSKYKQHYGYVFYIGKKI